MSIAFEMNIHGFPWSHVRSLNFTLGSRGDAVIALNAIGAPAYPCGKNAAEHQADRETSQCALPP